MLSKISFKLLDALRALVDMESFKFSDVDPGFRSRTFVGFALY